MAVKDTRPIYRWENARGLMPVAAPSEKGPQGALIPDGEEDLDHIAVVYDKGEEPPEITIAAVSGMVHAVLANGIAIAVVARSTGRAPTPADVLLVERAVHA